MTEHDVPDRQLPTGAGGAAEVEAVPAASTIVVRPDPFEILLLRRHERSTFVPGAWVFPGGALEESDRTDNLLLTMKRCAMRELEEETGIRVDDPDRLLLTARWITPVGVPKRFDTWFFLVEVPRATVATADQQEGVEVLWIAPHAALERAERGELSMVFPTIKNIEAVAAFPSPATLFQARRGAEIRTTRPVLIVENGRKRIILPE